MEPGVDLILLKLIELFTMKQPIDCGIGNDATIYCVLGLLSLRYTLNKCIFFYSTGKKKVIVIFFPGRKTDTVCG